jgi:hypothetical protein
MENLLICANLALTSILGKRGNHVKANACFEAKAFHTTNAGQHNC